MNAESRSRWGSIGLYGALLLGVVVAALLIRERWGFFAGESEPIATAPPLPSKTTAGLPPHVDAPAAPARPRWLAFGGGAEPVSNQVSLEQDLGLMQQVFGPARGVLLFAGGVGLSPVQVLQDPPPIGDLRQRLGALFDPRDGREAHYRPTTLLPHGEATVANVRRALRGAVREPGDPLFVFVAAHGEAGQSARDNYVTLWGAEAITVAELADIADRSGRALRFVITSCFSGGFAELAFTEADPKRGAAKSDRCGLFASTWDTAASGCDPNPDRRVQESYGLHFLRALQRTDREGTRLQIADLDLDKDGKLSLLEAHTRVRIAASSLMVPTTTSERWLRHAAPTAGEQAEVDLPEERRVIELLTAKLGMRDEADAKRRFDALTANAKHADEELSSLERKLDIHWNALRIALLERWPVLDDPYHPSYATTLKQEGDDVAAFLDRADAARRYEQAQEPVHRARIAFDEIDLESAQIHRLIRAHETVALAGRLAARGGPDWEHYKRLLACERTVPDLP